jgi:hypothetical protein
MEVDLSYKYDLDKAMRVDHSETNVFTKLAKEVAAEEVSMQNMSKYPSKQN